MSQSIKSYYEFIKGQDLEEIMSEISTTKKEIYCLKNFLENPSIKKEREDFSYLQSRIYKLREYLEAAKQEYAKNGGLYELTNFDKKILDFNKNFDELSQISFSTSDFFNGHIVYTIYLTGEFKTTTKDPLSSAPVESILLWNNDKQEAYTRETFIDAIKDIHIGEWRNEYLPERFGHKIIDGTWWSLVFEYGNGHENIKINGNHSFPYNFDKLQKIFREKLVDNRT